jgi:hypothetical protein
MKKVAPASLPVLPAIIESHAKRAGVRRFAAESFPPAGTPVPLHSFFLAARSNEARGRIRVHYCLFS